MFLVRAFAGGLSLETLWRLSGLFLVYECGDIYQSVCPGSFFSAKEPFGWLCSGCDSYQLSGHPFPFSYAGNAFEVILPVRNPDGFATFINTFSGILTMGFVTAGSAAISLFTHWLRHNLRIDQLESTTLQSELKFLKSQINPHFLFNMLNNANVLIKRNPEEASKVLFKLEDLLRYQINDSSRERVALASDIRFLNDYLNLEKIRRDHFQFTMEQEGDIDSIWIQPLLFIPFVENAVKHSFDSEHPSSVHLSFKVEENRLEFRCENTMPAVAVSNKVGGIGLANIQRRLGLLYPDRYELEQIENENRYMVTLCITL